MEGQIDDVLHRQLDRAVQMRSSQDITCWTIFAVFGAAQAVLISAIVDSKTNATNVVLAGVGLLSAVVWARIVYRALQYIDSHELVIRRLEGRLGIDDQHRIGHTPTPGLWPSSRTTMNLTTLLSTVAWLVALIIFLSRS